MGFKSTFSILPNTAVHWENNHTTSGGAMFMMLATYRPNLKWSGRITAQSARIMF